MENEKPTIPLHSYPNADRPVGAASDAGTENAVQRVPARPNGKVGGRSETGDATSNIRTYQSDVANAIRDDNVSVIKIALAEKKRQERKGVVEDDMKKSHFGLILIIISGLLILGGIGVILFGYFGANIFSSNTVPSSTTATTTPAASASLQGEKNISLNITGDDPNAIKQSVQREKSSDLALGSIEKVDFVEKNGSTTASVTLQQLFFQLKVRASDSLIRSLSPNYFFGIYSFSDPKDSFLLVNVDSYDQAYAGMIDWENDMVDDIGTLFVNQPGSTDILNNISRQNAQNQASTSTSQRQASFVDRVIDNKDARVLLDGSGNIEMLYTFLDQHTLLIASGPESLKEIDTRLTTGRIIR